MFILRSVRGWLTLLFLVLTALSSFAIWLYIVPPLRSRLVSQKLDDLSANSEFIVRSISKSLADATFDDGVPSGQAALQEEVSGVAYRLGARVALVDPTNKVVLADSQPGTPLRLKDYPVIGRATRSQLIEVGTTRLGKNEYAAAAVPVTVEFDGGETQSRFFSVALISSPLRDVNSAVRLVTRQILLATVLALAVTLVAGYLAAYLISRRLKNIERSAEAIAGGDFDVTVEVRVRDEIGQLADTFNTMGGRLEEAFGELEGEKRNIETLLNTLSEGVVGVSTDGRVAVANPAAAAFLGRALRPGEPIDEAFPAEVAELWRSVHEGPSTPLVVPTVVTAALGLSPDDPDAAPASSLGDGKPAAASPALGGRVAAAGGNGAPPAAEEAVSAALLAEEEQQVVFEFGERTLEAFTYAVRGGRTFDSIVVLRDITEEARLERARRDFVANASHEFKTPLFSIAGVLEVLDEEGLDPEERQEFLRLMREQVERMQNLSLRLLDLSQVDAGAVRLHMGAADATALAHSVLAEFHTRAAERHVRTEVVAPSSVAPVSCDEERLAQVLRALLDNAIKYTPDGGTVEVRVASGDGHVTIAVADNGTGIPNEELARVFDRFYRGSASRAAKAGTGLGLSIARDLTGLMGGTLVAESRVGVGSRFTISLPAEHADDVGSAAGPRAD
jgi:signal transduction histidine kinase